MASYPVSVRRVHDFVIGFLQIPPHGGHPCLDGQFRSSRSAGDFHPLNASHTEHTRAMACATDYNGRNATAVFLGRSTKSIGKLFGDLKVRPKLMVLHNLFFLV